MALEKPYSEQAERAIVGAMILDKNSVSYAVSVLSLEDFYLVENRDIFEAITLLKDRDINVDITSVANKLKELGKLEEAGGVGGLISLTESVTVPNVSYYVEILKDKTCLRKLATFIEDSYANYNGSSITDIGTYLSDFEENVLKITRSKNVSGFNDTKSLIENYNHLLNERKLKTNGVTTGFKYLDNVLNGGWKKGNLIIVAARPGCGKTALGLNFCVNAAKQNHTPVAFFSLEMSNEEITQRLISITGRLDNKKVQNGDFRVAEDLIRLEGATSTLKDLPIYIDDTANILLTDLINKCRKLKGEVPSLGLIVVDYLQIVECPGKKNDSREREVAKIATSLKGLARDLEIPVVALAQLGRATDKNKFGSKDTSNKRPELSDLRESGQIENDADIVAFIYKESFYGNNESLPDTEDIEFIIKKNRHGQPATVKLVLTSNTFKYDAKLVQNEEETGEVKNAN